MIAKQDFAHSRVSPFDALIDIYAIPAIDVSFSFCTGTLSHELGICFFVLENFKQADSYLSELLEKYPDYVEIASATALKIFCLIQERKYDDAIKQIDIRLKKYGNDPVLHGDQK